MRRLALVLLALLALPASAQHSPFLWSTKSILEMAAGLTDAGRFGAPGWATASLPTCNAANERAIAYDLTTNTLKFCNGSAWGEVGSTYAVFTGATGVANGTTGLVPQPLAGEESYFLRADSTWVNIPGGGDALVANPLSQFAATTSAQFAGVISDETGTGVVVLATSPTLVTPTLGVASATSINKVAITAPATSATLTVADGKTLTASNTLTLAGTDGTTMTFPGASDTVAGLGAANTFTTGNLIQPATDVAPLTLRRNVGATANLLQIQDESNNPILYVGPTGIVLNPMVIAPATDVAPLTIRQNVGATADLLQIQRSNNDAVLTVAANGSIVSEGTVDAHELTLAFADAGADATVTVPATTGTVVVGAAANTFTSTNDFGGGSLEIPNSTTLPATCTVGQVYQDTNATAASQFYVCTATDTWTAQGAGGGISGSTGATDNALLRADGVGGATLQASAVTVDDTTGALVFPAANNFIIKNSTDTDTGLYWDTGGKSMQWVVDNSSRLRLSSAVTAEAMTILNSLGIGFAATTGAGDAQIYRESAGVLRIEDGLVIKSTGSGTPTIFEVPPVSLSASDVTLIGGEGSGGAITSGGTHIVIGNNSLEKVSIHAGSIVIGHGAGNGIAAERSLVIGNGSGGANTSYSLGNYNTILGNGSGPYSLGAENVTVGHSTLVLNASGVTGNTCVGYASCGQGGGSSDADYQIALGHGAGGTDAYDDCLSIGRESSCTASNTANLGSTTAHYATTTTTRATTGSADVQTLNSEQITLSTGGTTTNSSGNIVPANSIIDAIACRITTEITTATDWGVSITGDAAWNQIGTTDTTVATLTAGATAIFVAPAHDGQYNDTATTITITTTGTPGAGVIRCAVHSRTFTPPTS